MDNRYLILVSFKVRFDRYFLFFERSIYIYLKLSVKLMISMMIDDLSSGGLNSLFDIEVS